MVISSSDIVKWYCWQGDGAKGKLVLWAAEAGCFG